MANCDLIIIRFYLGKEWVADRTLYTVHHAKDANEVQKTLCDLYGDIMGKALWAFSSGVALVFSMKNHLTEWFPIR